MQKRSFHAVAIACLTSIAACGVGSSERPPPTVPSGPGAHCKVTASHNRPLIVEWDAASRNDLESMLKRDGAVVVRYAGCELELLRSCRAPGAYEYVPGTRQDESVSMRNADELYAKMPLGAAALEGAVARSGELRLDLSMVGKYVQRDPVLAFERLAGDTCAGATHVVVGLTAGAFEMVAGSSVSGKTSLLVAGGSTSGSQEILRRAGTPASCDRAKHDDAKPPAGCGALLRIELVPVECPYGVKAEPGAGCGASAGSGLVAASAPPGSSSNADPAERAFARLVLDTAQAILAAAQGKTSGMEVEFRTGIADARRALDSVGPGGTVLVAGAELELHELPTPGRKELVTVYEEVQIQGNGRLRWGNATSSVKSTPEPTKLPLDGLAEPLLGIHRRMLLGLKSPSCELLPAATSEDSAYLGIPNVSDVAAFQKPAELKEACSRVAAATGSWDVDVPEVRILFGTAKKHIELKVHIRPKTGGGFIADRVLFLDK